MLRRLGQRARKGRTIEDFSSRCMGILRRSLRINLPLLGVLRGPVQT